MARKIQTKTEIEHLKSILKICSRNSSPFFVDQNKRIANKIKELVKKGKKKRV